MPDAPLSPGPLAGPTPGAPPSPSIPVPARGPVASGPAIVLLLAVLAGVLGPRITAPHDRAAGAPFVYEPPAGFDVPPPETQNALMASVPGATAVWQLADAPGGYAPNVSVTHTDAQGRVEPSDLAALAQGMPALFAGAGADGGWTLVRHETRARADRAHVGLLEGESARGALRYRTLQLVFPDDRGTSVVTATYLASEAALWAPKLEATIETAHGVATRLPPPPGWLHLVWAAGGGLLGLLLAGVLARAGAVRRTRVRA